MNGIPPIAADESDYPVEEEEDSDMNANNEIPEGRRIQDFETWLANNALRGRPAPDEDEQQGDAADSSSPSRNWNADQRAALERIREHERYQQELHERYFGSDKGGNDTDTNTNGESASADIDRRETLQRFGSRRFTFLARASAQAVDENRPDSNAMTTSTRISTSRVDDSTIALSVPLRTVAEQCETVYVAASRHSCHQMRLVKDDSNMHELYPESAVSYLLRVMLGEAVVEDTPDPCAVDCCRLAHYLQNSELVDAYGTLLTNSVDSENCLSLLQLAEQLRLPSLWERSLQQVLDTMDRVEWGGNEGSVASSSDAFMTSELRDRVTTIQAVIRSSVHGPCTASRTHATATTTTSTSRLFFSSVEEYVSIFAERVQYFRERLADAKAQRDELLGIREDRNDAMPAVGRFVSTRRDRFFAVPGGLSQQYVDDLQAKIERQERRVQTLEIALKEHKKLLYGLSQSN